MRPYSQDLRDRVIAAIETQQETQLAVAEQFGIALSTVEKWWTRWQATGSSAAWPPASGPTRVLQAYGAFLRAAVKKQPDVTLAELGKQLQTTKHVSVSESMVCRELHILQLPRKKSLHDSQRQTHRVRRKRTRFKKDFMAEVSTQLQHLKFIDESGVNLGLTRTHGRARPGQRVVEATPGHSSTRYTTIATLGWRGVQAPWIWEGAMNAEIFEAYITKHLGPHLRRGDIVVADNLLAHKCKGVRAYLEARGIQLVFLPPYSPDFNPIELCWSKVKTALRAAKARTWEALVEALAKALRSVRPDDVKAWFAHCGYALP